MEANTDLHPDKIFVRHGLTEFEKLLFAESYIKQLEREKKELLFKLGQMSSYQEEAKDIIEGKEKLTKEEKSNLKKDEYVQGLISQIKTHDAAMKGLRKENRDLLDELLKYRYGKNGIG